MHMQQRPFSFKHSFVMQNRISFFVRPHLGEHDCAQRKEKICNRVLIAISHRENDHNHDDDYYSQKTMVPGWLRRNLPKLLRRRTINVSLPCLLLTRTQRGASHFSKEIKRLLFITWQKKKKKCKSTGIEDKSEIQNGFRSGTLWMHYETGWMVVAPSSLFASSSVLLKENIFLPEAQRIRKCFWILKKRKYKRWNGLSLARGDFLPLSTFHQSEIRRLGPLRTAGIHFF